MTTEQTDLVQFRQLLYQNFNNRADTIMELIDALCSSPAAQSLAELTLAPCFRRTYSTLYKGVDQFDWEDLALACLLAPYLPSPRERDFWLLGVDVTPQPRPFAATLTDRSMVYQPALIKGNKPVTVGHQYSTVALLPEREAHVSGSWIVPLMAQRVATSDDKELVGAGQISALLKEGKLPFGDALTVVAGDASYSKPSYLHANHSQGNMVVIVRARGTRTFYRQFVQETTEKRSGHPKWYGQAFSLQDQSTWPIPDEQTTLTEFSSRGKRYRVEIQAWHHLLMRGKQKPSHLPMHRHPFTLVRIVRYDEQGRQIGERPLWLIVMGPRRQELSLVDIYHAYGQRYDLEHFFRFGKQKLLLIDYQTPETDREVQWWQIVHIAYTQLWMARHVAHLLPRPWERNLPAMRTRSMSPTLVQRDFGRIIRQLGTPAKPPKHRGNSPGRRKGTKLTPRPRQKVVVKRLLKADPP